ncbi:MAG: hypothetical protein FWG13_00410 [Leptospirales bacterium]|nr:hypothetical protein [Leptospirales bacterium]
MNSQPFSIFKRKDGKYFYVSFKNDDGKYSCAKSTKQTKKDAAIRTAWEWQINGMPVKTKNGNVRVPISIKQSLSNVTVDDISYLCEQWIKKGFLKSYVLPETKAAIDFIQYMFEFWDYDKSPYVKEKLRKSHSIHKKHCFERTSKIKIHWQPYFQGRMLGDITREDLENFIDDMGDMFCPEIGLHKKIKGVNRC